LIHKLILLLRRLFFLDEFCSFRMNSVLPTWILFLNESVHFFWLCRKAFRLFRILFFSWLNSVFPTWILFIPEWILINAGMDYFYSGFFFFLEWVLIMRKGFSRSFSWMNSVNSGIKFVNVFFFLEWKFCSWFKRENGCIFGINNRN
jgi:hypothetical protein